MFSLSFVYIWDIWSRLSLEPRIGGVQSSALTTVLMEQSIIMLMMVMVVMMMMMMMMNHDDDDDDNNNNCTFIGNVLWYRLQDPGIKS